MTGVSSSTNNSGYVYNFGGDSAGTVARNGGDSAGTVAKNSYYGAETSGITAIASYEATNTWSDSGYGISSYSGCSSGGGGCSGGGGFSAIA